MNCRDCLHYEVCRLYSKKIRVPMSKDDICDIFTNRSEWVHLPCKVGRQLWFEKDGKVKVSTVDRLVYEELSADDIFTRIDGYGFSVFFEDIGKIVFLTREEAEKTLEEKKGANESDK